MRAAAGFEPGDKWFGQQAVYRVSMGSFVSGIFIIIVVAVLFICLPPPPAALPACLPPLPACVPNNTPTIITARET